MESITDIIHTLGSFALVISIIVFVHEFGHFIVARACGVKVETFSIGFGPELCGFTDRKGTRWKLAAFPLGGYVKMFGDDGAASTPDTKRIRKMTAAEKKLSFHHKTLWAKTLIVAAGPAFNFLLAIGIFTYFIATVGLASTAPVIGKILPNTPAAWAGLKPDDRILTVDGTKIHSFSDITRIVSLNLGTPITFEIAREDKTFSRRITPVILEDVDALGNRVKHPLIGMKSRQLTYEETHLAGALWAATQKTYDMCVTSLKVLGQMLRGDRSTDELKGPLGIAKLSGDVTEQGDTFAETFRLFLWFVALLSVNLGLVNLFPIPMLDGGHLLFYVLEAVRGRPLAERFQEYSYRFGLVVLVGLMAFSLLNDIQQMF